MFQLGGIMGMQGRRRAASSFADPSALSPEGWWRADLGHSLSDTDPVTSWANQGSEGDLDFAQGTASRQPAYDASHSSFNSQAVIDFGTSDVMASIATHAWESADGVSFSVVVLHRPTYAGDQPLIATASYTSGGFLLKARTNGTCTNDVRDGSTFVSANGATLTQNAVTVQALVYDGTATESVSAWKDGVETSGSSASMGAIDQVTAREFIIGGQTPTLGLYLGQVAELILIKRVLTSGEDADLASYFNSRYGLSLPGVTL